MKGYDRQIEPTLQGISRSTKRIHLHTPVKTLGKHETSIKLHADVSVTISFDVVSENPIEVAPVVEAPKSDYYPEKKSARRPKSDKAKSE